MPYSPPPFPWKKNRKRVEGRKGGIRKEE